MRKIMTLLFAVLLAFSLITLVACADDDESIKKDKPVTTSGAIGTSETSETYETSETSGTSESNTSETTKVGAPNLSPSEDNEGSKFNPMIPL